MQVSATVSLVISKKTTNLDPRKKKIKAQMTNVLQLYCII